MPHFNIPFLLSMGGGQIDSLEKLIAHIVVFGLMLLFYLSAPAAIAAVVLIVIAKRKARLLDDTSGFDGRRAVTGMNPPKPKLRWFQFSLGRVLFISMLALSFGLLRKAYLVFDPYAYGGDIRWLISGLCLLGATLGFTTERRCDPRRSGITWMLIGVLLGFLLAICIAALTAK
jgi:hypothetical protein